MSTRLSATVLGLGLALGLLLPAAAQEAGKDEAGWKALFDKKSLDGWKSADFYAAGKVQVKDEAIIMEKGKKRIGILGFSFKPGTDDLRDSPMIEIIERLAGKGYDIRIYDKNVQVASLVGANRDFILNRIPHISRLMVDSMDAVLQHAETIVIGHRDEEFQKVPQLLQKGQSLVDFVRIANNGNNNGDYDGICW